VSRGFFAVLLIAVAAGLVGWTYVRASDRPSELLIDTAGREEPAEGALLENGWRIEDRGEANLKEVYLRNQGFLGEPVTGFDGATQTFRLGRLGYQPNNPPDWKIEFANLGWLDMQTSGLTPNPGRTPHPALRDWLQAQLEVGLDLPRVVGRIISEPVCEGGSCRQWTDKQRFQFPREALTADQVQRAPLGLWLSYPASRPHTVAAGQATVPPVPLILAGVCGLLGLALLRARGGPDRIIPI